MPVATEVTFQREGVADLWPDLMPLLEAHYAELGPVSPFTDEPLDVDQDTYDAIDAMGAYRAYTARADGKVVGYAGFFVRSHLHHRGLMVASHDVLYVLPEHRGLASLQLIVHAGRSLRAEGVRLISHTALLGSDFARILEHLGYQSVEATFIRRIAG